MFTLYLPLDDESFPESVVRLDFVVIKYTETPLVVWLCKGDMDSTYRAMN